MPDKTNINTEEEPVKKDEINTDTEPSMDLFDLTDDEIMNADESKFITDNANDNDSNNDDDNSIDNTDDGDDNNDDGNIDSTNKNDKDNKNKSVIKSDTEKDIYQEDIKPEEKTNKQDKIDNEIDYKAIYNQIFAPFKANGTQMQAKSPEDVIRLMQMGANYPQKMGALKPHLKIVKLLEKNDLLDINKLNYLIDLNNKNEKAIGKLLTDSKIDPMSLDMEDTSYVPTQRSVDDIELELDEVLSEIKTSPVYDKTINVITNNWDTQSRNTLANTPQLIKLINEHMELGIYDDIAKEMAYSKSLNKYPGITDLDLYSKIGNKLNAEGKFNKYYSPQSKGKTASSKIENNKRKQLKKAAAPTRKSSNTPAKQIKFDPLNMSDEEIMKIDETQLDKYILK